MTNLDPISEMENVQTELILSDIEVCHKKRGKVSLSCIILQDLNSNTSDSSSFSN